MDCSYSILMTLYNLFLLSNTNYSSQQCRIGIGAKQNEKALIASAIKAFLSNLFVHF